MEWQREWTVKELKEKIFQSQNAIQKYGWGCPYLENYPFESAEELRDPVAKERYKQAGECGEDTGKVLAYLRARGRDNSRTPMQWNTDVNAGFSTVTPWINVNPNYVNINAQQVKEPKSIYNYYKEMVRLRSSSEYGQTLTYGDFQAIVTKEDNFICYSRHDGQYEIIVMINFGDKMVTVQDDLRGGKVILNNRTENDDILRPYQAVVKVREK